MERRLNKKIETYVTTFKDNIREKALNLGLLHDDKSNQLIQYVYDYERLTLNKDDFVKRKRVKNVVPLFDRCCAKRATNEQCSRRKKDGSEYCGTHMKGTPHGIIDNTNETKINTQKVDVWAQEIKGIVYYIDAFNNVYQAEDIVSNKLNPKIIAKYNKNDDVYTLLFDGYMVC
jgi:hypothetical protein